jgi:hypothetical protein
LEKTVRVREAAKAGLDAETRHPDCALFQPAIDAVATFKELKGDDESPIHDLTRIVFCVTAWVEELPEEIGPAYIRNALQAQSMYVMVHEDDQDQLINIPPPWV